MTGGHRLPRGGRVDRSRPLRFSFDGVDLEGFAGDTLASALLANGVAVVARSTVEGRPRGIVAAGVEEPNALVEVELAGAPESLIPATRVELFEGLVAWSRAGVGRARLTPTAVDDGSAEAAESDAAPDRTMLRDPAAYDAMHLTCDVLVVGGGPAGLAAAWAAGRTGARVVLVDEGSEFGGSLLATRDAIDGRPAEEWADRRVNDLAGLPEVRLVPRATALGTWDAGSVVVAERRTDHLGPAAPGWLTRARLWHLRARRVVLATGAHERLIVFAGNDRPGIMLAGAVRTYLNRYGVAAGRRAVLFTVDDLAYATALELADAGVDVAAILDARPEPIPEGSLPAFAREAGLDVRRGWAVVGTTGDDRLSGVAAVRLAERRTAGGPVVPVGEAEPVACDLLGVSGGWNPVVHLWTHAGGTVRYEATAGSFLPDRTIQPHLVAGSARGLSSLAAVIADGAAAGAEAARLAGFGDGSVPEAPRVTEIVPGSPRTLWVVPGATGDPATWSTHYVDLQRDATAADVHRAIGAGLRSIEHVKRYTLVGTAADQGRTSGVAAIGIAAELLGLEPGEVGTTTFRPPYTPVPFGLLAGRDQGALLEPVRTTPMHAWHVAHGAVFEPVGQWRRARFYPQPGEDMDAAVLRECRAARESVGLTDASTLGKIDLQGRDAGAFLDRIYANTFSTLAVGSARYGIMLQLDGMIFDDGVTTRLAPDRFHMTTTTGGAAAVMDWIEEYLQTEWPDLDVRATSVTEQWAVAAIVGPRARDVLSRLAPDLDVSARGFPFMTVREATVAGIPARVFRISFSGELAYEVNVPGWYGQALWEAIMAAGEPFGIAPYGTEAMHVLRAEKGYVIVGQDTDGNQTPFDVGLGWMVSKAKDFLGRRSLRRPEAVRADRRQLVGLLPLDPEVVIPEGAQLVTDRRSPIPMPMVGHVTSSYRSAALGRTFALALVEGGRSRHGEVVHAPLPGGTIAATIVDPVLYDRENSRRDG